jgi:hypothetical protein
MNDLINNLAVAIQEDTLQNGGLVYLHWMEKEATDRQNSVYSAETIAALKAASSLFDNCNFYGADEQVGLSLEIPPVSEEQANEACSILKRFLSPQDYESLEWDVCKPGGRLLW